LKICVMMWRSDLCKSKLFKECRSCKVIWNNGWFWNPESNALTTMNHSHPQRLNFY
jgi:hypothetical protein